MNAEELRAAIEAHGRWLQADPNGKRADLRGVNLQGVNLQGVNLRGANLRVADLGGADLSGANLRWADLSGANLRGADFCGANLQGADLCRASLYGANLRGADLSEANLSEANLGGAKVAENLTLQDAPRVHFQVGPIGSRADMLTLWLTASGPRLQTGCFLGTLDEFKANLAKDHPDDKHGEEYTVALGLIEAHARLWGTKEEE